MSQLVFIENKKVVTDSLTIAEMFGKGHDNVLRDVRKQMEYAGEEFSLLNFEESSYHNKQNKVMPKFNLTEEAFTLVVFSYNTKEAVQTKIKFIQEFKRMREYIEKQQTRPLSEKEQLKASMKLSLITSEEVESLKVEVGEVKEQVQSLVDKMRIDGVQEFKLRSQGQAKVLEVLGGIESSAYKQVGRKAFAELWREFKRHFQLPRYSELAKSQFDEGVYFISKWRPSTSLQIEIDQCNNQLQLKLVKVE